MTHEEEDTFPLMQHVSSEYADAFFAYRDRLQKLHERGSYHARAQNHDLDFEAVNQDTDYWVYHVHKETSYRHYVWMPESHMMHHKGRPVCPGCGRPLTDPVVQNCTTANYGIVHKYKCQTEGILLMDDVLTVDAEEAARDKTLAFGCRYAAMKPVYEVLGTADDMMRTETSVVLP